MAATFVMRLACYGKGLRTVNRLIG